MFYCGIGVVVKWVVFENFTGADVCMVLILANIVLGPRWTNDGNLDQNVQDIGLTTLSISQPGWGGSFGSFSPAILLLLLHCVSDQHSSRCTYSLAHFMNKQTNDCGSIIWWCWLEMSWNFGKLEESAYCLNTQLQVLNLFCWFYYFSQILQEFWIILYFRLKNLESAGNVRKWICFRMGFYGFAQKSRSIFQELQIWPQKTSFPQFLAAASPGWVVLLEFLVRSFI